MKINIVYKSSTTTKNIAISPNKCFVNNIEKNMDCNIYIFKILNIVSNWKSKTINPNIIDGFSYKIQVEDGLTKNYEVVNAYPKNFKEFEKVIKEIENC